MLLSTEFTSAMVVRNFSLPRQHPCAHSLPLSGTELKLLPLLPCCQVDLGHG